MEAWLAYRKLYLDAVEREAFLLAEIYQYMMAVAFAAMTTEDDGPQAPIPPTSVH